MSNSSDLRYIKTERLIEETYMRLKQQHSDTPIKVTELCQAALINKTTFYAHYDSISALHEHVCRKAVVALLNDCPHIDEAFTRTDIFAVELVQKIRDNALLSETLFGTDLAGETNVFESCLLEHYLPEKESESMRMKIIFAIGGASRLIFGNPSDECIRTAISLILQVING